MVHRAILPRITTSDYDDGNRRPVSGVQGGMKLSPHRFAPIPLALLLMLAACSGRSGPSGGQIAHPPGDQLVLRVEHRGGLMIAGGDFINFPAFTLLGDGRVFLPGAQAAIFPGPALPPVQIRQLTEDGVQTILHAVAASGQFAASAEWRGAQNFVADAADTVFTLNADGRTVTVAIYGLGTVMPGDEPPNFPAAEKPVHQALSQLLERLSTLDTWMPVTAWAADQAWQPYAPGALRLLVRNADADPPDSSGIANQELPWPTATDPATFGAATEFGDFRCGVVAGDDAAAWYEALSNANQLTRFVADDHRYEVSARQLLPGEAEECPAEA